ncbi:ATP-dependent Clp protease adapter ClpS [Microbacterium sp.]|uniref:ATP-dependent Clp protease adapter ClpS n=1 Tax=Microbacterium sp. TaxID=51671 RepID=UPI002D799833|nr:ATP-dependent Clp protease adapter ClpS [Microbacterium sp.]HET6301671.1 ATP-dependent Clp protease adapter ClpS [Microbacterium sp.]
MASSTLSLPDLDRDLDLDIASTPDRPWQTVVWNDPVNLMSYVVHVFQEYFGFSRAKAERLMLAVHHEGHAVVAEGPREQMELHAQAMHDYGLWATIRKAPE